jgi:hypothetical protein
VNTCTISQWFMGSNQAPATKFSSISKLPGGSARHNLRGHMTGQNGIPGLGVVFFLRNVHYRTVLRVAKADTST